MSVVLGLTGSIGMGKSTTAQMFADAGCAVWDADAVVHRLYAPEGPAPALLDAAFPGVIRADGHVDRNRLRELVADDPSVLDKINAIVHPLVATDRAEFLATATGLVVLDIPLLFENGSEALCDRVAVVSVDAQTQKDRVLARGTMSEVDFETILSRQVPDADKRARADYVIDTSTLEIARARVNEIIAELS